MKPVLIDSSAWIEFLSDGPLAGVVEPYLKRPERLVVPTIVLYEVYKKLKAFRGEDAAMDASAQLARSGPVPLTEAIAFSAADLSLAHKLGMADAVVLATARAAGAELVTLDSDFEGLPGATVLR